jgi:hypothetical protein
VDSGCAVAWTVICCDSSPVTDSYSYLGIHCDSYVTWFIYSVDKYIYPVCVPDSRSFHTAVTKVKSGKGTSAFSDRTDDSSAMQYFQVSHVSQQFYFYVCFNKCGH